MKDSIGLYFDEISKATNLSAGEEKKLAQLIEKGRRAERSLEKGRWGLLKKKTFRRNIREGKKAREEFIERNLRLVIVVAKRFLTFWGEFKFGDLIQEGNMGLIHAVDKFNWREGCRFSTYAIFWIRQSIIRGIGDKGIQIRIPIYLRECLFFLGRTTEALRTELGREPNLEEVAEKIKLSPQKTEVLEKRARTIPSVISLETVTGENGEKEGLDLIALVRDKTEKDPREDISYELLKKNFSQIFEKILRPREREILEKRFGFNCSPKTLKETSVGLGITRERVRQIQDAAIEKIRRRISRTWF